MKTEQIGINAGLVWNTLEKNGKMNTKDVRKATKIKDKDLTMALGWLARESKITFKEEGKELFVSLA